MQDKIKELGRRSNINTSDWFGKYLMMQDVLSSMDKQKADEFMSDTLMMLSDEIDAILEKEYGIDEAEEDRFEYERGN